MTALQRRVDETRATNPLFNDRKLKLGTFCTNLSGGCTMSEADGMLDCDWPSTTRLAQLADDMEFEALVPVGRWKGLGGATDFNGRGFECYTWAAGISALTKYPGCSPPRTCRRCIRSWRPNKA
jgi:hypothetical protein